MLALCMEEKAVWIQFIVKETYWRAILVVGKRQTPRRRASKHSLSGNLVLCALSLPFLSIWILEEDADLPMSDATYGGNQYSN